MLFVVSVIAAYLWVPTPWSFVLVAVAAVVEVAETLFWIKLSRRRQVQVGAETLLGAQGVVTEACRPYGQVRLAGEIWQARCEVGAAQGTRVQVTGREGLVLVVQPVSGPE